MRLSLLFMAVFIAGCAPYVGYTHLSDPRVTNDGYDLVCIGLKGEYLLIESTFGFCENTAAYGGEFVKLDLEYVWR